MDYYNENGKTLLDFNTEYIERFMDVYEQVEVLANHKGEKR